MTGYLVRCGLGGSLEDDDGEAKWYKQTAARVPSYYSQTRNRIG